MNKEKLEIALMEILVDFNFKNIGFEVTKNQIMSLFNDVEEPIIDDDGDDDEPIEITDKDLIDFREWWNKLPRNKKK
jgi:hypothetical protein